MYKVIKRVFDFICAILGILVTSPLWLVAIVGIVVSDPGPIFYTSTRIGKDNKPFRMFKFRSMRIDKKANESCLRPDADRIFPFGKFIRKVKIDELPQLLNILNGSMAVIGPRPVAQDQFDLFRTGKWDESKTVAVGLSGPAALYDFIYGDQFEDPEEYMEKVFETRRNLELVYVKKMSLVFDAKMIVWTVICIVYAALGKECTWMLEKLRTWSKEV